MIGIPKISRMSNSYDIAIGSNGAKKSIFLQVVSIGCCKGSGEVVHVETRANETPARGGNEEAAGGT